MTVENEFVNAHINLMCNANPFNLEALLDSYLMAIKMNTETNNSIKTTFSVSYENKYFTICIDANEGEVTHRIESKLLA